MNSYKRWIFLMVGLLPLWGCAHRQLEVGALQDVARLAVVVRVQRGPEVTVAQQGDGRAFPTLSPKEADEQLQGNLAKQVKTFELEERLREALVSTLPAEPPWSTAMSASDVATALQSFLVLDRSMPVDYEALRLAGADAVLELQVTHWGVAKQGRVGLFLKGSGKLFRLPGRSGLWADALDTDLAMDPEVEAVDVVALKNGGFREAVITLVKRLADRIGPQLAGRR